MRTDSEWSHGPGIKVSAAIKLGDGWLVSAVMSGVARCPSCSTRSSRRHGWCERRLQDLPAQGAAVKLTLKVARWLCLNRECAQRTFADRGQQIVAPYGRRTLRIVDVGGPMIYHGAHEITGDAVSRHEPCRQAVYGF